MNDNKNYVREITNIEDDFAKWYTDIVIKADLADYTDVKGFMAIKPYGFAIWENIKEYADKEFKKVGVKNVYLPLLIPEDLLNKEKDHIEGFAPEVAWVTHGGAQELENRFCIRPTSETLFSNLYGKWVKSWRDLPMVYNQWCSVIRWEKETKPFLRTREFLWQEGHTVHDNAEEAKDLTLKMLSIYRELIEKKLAIPVLQGEKTETEKFAGAENTYTVETLMHDGKILQAGTSHYFGQNFSRPFKIKFLNKNEEEEYVYQTSWGISTRLIGAIIMAHGDNRGLKLPPEIAPIQVIIVPISLSNEVVTSKANELFDVLNKSFRVEIDKRDNYSPGYKFNDWEMKGVPVRIEIGPKDVLENQCIIVERDTGDKTAIKLDDIDPELRKILNNIQKRMFDACKNNKENRTSSVNSLDEFVERINENQGYIKAMWCGDKECEAEIREKTGAKSRCVPFEQEKISDKCVVCGKKAKHLVFWGRQY
ncbi:MAG: proline--tRNA ligase [Candidatus Pacebacteria bacterium]|nr:proline--tRNA ligase [Candidatus Paceibacterota bacterium]